MKEKDDKHEKLERANATNAARMNNQRGKAQKKLFSFYEYSLNHLTFRTHKVTPKKLAFLAKNTLFWQFRTWTTPPSLLKYNYLDVGGLRFANEAWFWINQDDIIVVNVSTSLEH